jgi:hypothetical protein
MPLIILAVVIILSLILIVLGMPGLWIMVASAVTYNLVVKGDPIGWFTLVAVAVLVGALTGVLLVRPGSTTMGLEMMKGTWVPPS